MKEFFYRLSGDKDFRDKFIKWSLISFMVLAVCFAFVVLLIGNLSAPEYEDNTSMIGLFDNDDRYNLQFFGHEDYPVENNDNEETEEDNDNNDSEDNKSEVENNTSSNNSSSENNENTINNNSNNNSSSNGGSSGSSQVHTHSGYKVIDQGAGDESKGIQKGTKYVCTSCGFSSMDSGSMQNHRKQTKHSFRTEAVMEEKKIHHNEISHYECSCGARQ